MTFWGWLLVGVGVFVSIAVLAFCFDKAATYFSGRG